MELQGFDSKYLSFIDVEDCSVGKLYGDGVFNVNGLENFMKEVRLGDCRLSYVAVSIMGPQSSVKSN
ncbi:unnamed protein product [Urochloa humidicola]